MNLSGRERRMVVLRAFVLLLAVGWLVFLRPSSDPISVPDGALATATATVAPSPDGASSASSTFSVPPGTRDPFKP